MGTSKENDKKKREKIHRELFVSSHLDDFMRWHTSFEQCGDTCIAYEWVGYQFVADF